MNVKANRLILIPLIAWAIGCRPEAPKDLSNVSVTSLDGTSVKLGDFKGKIVFLDFWAPWCEPCVEGLPFTQRLHDSFKDKGLVVLAISNDPKDSVQPFLSAKHYTFPCYLDADGTAAKTFEVEGIPHTVIIGRDGKMVDEEEGLAYQADTIRVLAKAGLDTTGFAPENDPALNPN